MTFEIDGRTEVTFERFVEVNNFTDEDVERLESMDVGDEIRMGGQGCLSVERTA